MKKEITSSQELPHTWEYEAQCTSHETGGKKSHSTCAVLMENTPSHHLAQSRKVVRSTRFMALPMSKQCLDNVGFCMGFIVAATDSTNKILYLN